MREWKKKNRDKKREQDKKYREAHKEEIKAYHKAWRDNNREHLNEQQKARYKENPQMFKEINNRYKASHQEAVKEARTRYKTENRQKCTDYERNKRHNDPVYRFRTSSRHLIWMYAKNKGYTKPIRVWEMIGCDFNTFLAHIQSQFEEGMTLENYGNGENQWNIDHIIPISTANTDEDIERLNHYTNLRPLWSTDNYKKSRKTP